MILTDVKKLNELCIKLTNLYDSPFILKSGLVISLDPEEPYLTMLDENQIKLFEDFNHNTFQFLNIFVIRDFKKVLSDTISEAKANKETEVTLPDMDKLYTTNLPKSMQRKVMDRVNKFTSLLKEVDSWDKFRLSDSDEDNDNLLLKIFKQNDYMLFLPKKSSDDVPIIFTKSLLPMISEKNYDVVSYATMIKNDDLHLIIFESKLPLFVVYMFHYYIPFE